MRQSEGAGSPEGGTRYSITRVTSCACAEPIQNPLPCTLQPLPLNTASLFYLCLC